MRDFVGRYDITGAPDPETWKKQLESLTGTSQVEVRSSLAIDGQKLAIRCRVPEEASDPKAMAQAFFEQVGAALSGAPDSGTVVSLKDVELFRPRSRIDMRRLRKAAWSTLQVAVVVATILAALVVIAEGLLERFGRAGLIGFAAIPLFAIVGIAAWFNYDTANDDEARPEAAMPQLVLEEERRAKRMRLARRRGIPPPS
ncbi:hypothetical protein [Archangium violaceum]|uniref:Uncharacterized protein n=1 Tax=Archangium violaceum Cb vi76 TaxID=1406225 RepID=A0A084SGG7_9BACT|nr:hypothetical protein [Archangium violaceum]KFA87552.1 hypothetical protein Q664_46860 [Archangium violaceum Cb vi76]